MLIPPVFVSALQVQTAGSVDRETLLVIFVGIIALFFLALIAAVIAGAIYAIRLKKQVLMVVESVKGKAYPLVDTTHGIIKDLTPKIKSISDDVTEISHTIRAQVTDLDSTLSDVTAKARSQADRVNGMVSSTLNTTANVAQSVEHGIRVPFREVAGIIAGVKAGLQALTTKSPAQAKTQVKRASEHLDEWDASLARSAASAAAVNRPSSASGEAVQQAGAEVPMSAASSMRRSIVEAGDEVTSVGTRQD